MKPYIEPKDKAKYNYLYKGYLKGFVSAETFIGYCQDELSILMRENEEVLKQLKGKEKDGN